MSMTSSITMRWKELQETGIGSHRQGEEAPRSLQTDRPLENWRLIPSPQAQDLSIEVWQTGSE